MKTQWSSSWKGSLKPRKQRAYARNAPFHIKSAFMMSALSKDLRGKHKMRSARVHKGDLVKILRGQFKKHSGKVEDVNTGRQRIFVAGAAQIKKDGSKSLYPIHPSNVMILEFDTAKARKFGKTASAKPAAAETKKSPATKAKKQEKKQ